MTRAAAPVVTTLVDYVRDQVNELPKPAPENVNIRSSLLRRVFRFYFHDEMPDHGQRRIADLIPG
jgi:hypothetical protein